MILSSTLNDIHVSFLCVCVCRAGEVYTGVCMSVHVFIFVCTITGVQRWSTQHEPAVHPEQAGPAGRVSAGHGAGRPLRCRQDYCTPLG